MSGFLSGLLTAVAVVATVVTGGALGIVAGALIATSYAASKGWIGGSVGKFFTSSTGKDLTMAVGLAAGASAYLSDSGAVTAASSATTTNTAAADVDAATNGAISAAGNQAVAGTAANAGAAADAAGASNAAAASAGSAAAATPSGTMAMTGSNLNAYASSMQGADPTITSASGLQPQEIQAAQKAADLSAQANGFAGTGSNVTTGEVPDAATRLGITNTNQTDATQLGNAQAATASKGTDTVNTNAGEDLTPVDTSQAAGQAKVNAAAAAGDQAKVAAAPEQAPGLLSQAGSALKNNPALAQVAGQGLAGAANGMAQQKMIEEQIAAQQWGNSQWQNATQVAQLNAAAAAPINVPVGYLNRAAAVRNLMNGSTNQQTSLTGGTPAGVPSASSAPQPTVAPVGMQNNGPMQPAPITVGH